MNKKMTKWLSMALACGMLFSTAACGKTGGNESGGSGPNELGLDVPTGGDPDSTDTLDVYLLLHGYGQDWLISGLNRFAKEDWVKAKYPKLSINYTFDSKDSTAHQKLSQGASINKYDLLFSVNLQGYEDTGMIADLTDLVYLAEVPGESGTKVIDKVPEYCLNTVRNASADERADGNDTYMIVSYIQSFWSMMYNADILKQLQKEVPVTTDEFLELGDYIATNGYTDATGATNKNVIVNRAAADYWRNSYDIWWSQYEGEEGVLNYYEGYDPIEEQTNSSAVLQQAGRLESLKVIESILTRYRYPKTDEDFKVVQSAFLMGDGVFHYNGDYFACEMQTEISELKNNYNIDYDIQYMKMPVVSAIVNKTPSVKTAAEAKGITADKMLQSIIREIDADKTYDESQAKADGVTEEDFEIIVSARCYAGLSQASNQSVVIPSYAAGKNIAADFLRFMYTDESIKDFTVSSVGLIFPTTYDIVNDTEVYSKIQPIHKSKINLMKGTSNYPFTYSYSAGATRLGKGGLESLYYKGKFEVNFALDEDDRETAEDILKNEADHWNKNTWDQMVAAAGA